MGYQYLNAEEMIKNTIIFGEGNNNYGNPTFHIAYGIDRNFLFGCGVSIASILLHNSNRDFVFHVFIDELPDDEKIRFSQQAKLFNTCIQIHIVNCEKLKSFPTTKNWSVAMYFRFIIGDYFISQQDRVLYLDADIICNNDISALYKLDLDNKVAGVVAERDEKWWELRAKSLEYYELAKGYFNSGVLLLNINEWAKEGVSDKAISMLSNKDVIRKLTYMDQDILNMILPGKVKFIDGRFNTQFSINYELKDSFICPIYKDTALIHYVGPTKPWHCWACYPSTIPFMEAKQKSSWKDNALMKPTNSNYFRYCAKHNFKQKKILKGIKNYLYYFYLKIIK
ncbi:lipopolysaccharide 3-alpha-galactosyltransferase [Citrobacter amalonaticus]|uniref:Lipopolysaccharide 3-alpha-galactosyltransferase n=1 Tax=Citrobacter amalonaticus TaxID=35703 RepID=A0A2S4RVH4_CITAM|nr:lipopolysaccharide 3-alpha-galactosyltransferase [Citrobacter amalonaticus]POT55640.1 lipopolysaccharide 3-alpha-galactosyltransferase [Citrobacter amalonaticus]POT73852.1 lipopolysaccharide 3-alpha-galactosyltransferase [Citrobacter amalonaticus]POU64077.1 lipopolysaccharide 3-alpha-galactosyltransferase [Citrobacter amalonaticus]POV03709.1 lipopolysaccharide 3-alpha-galactosyltransferase [Citrobacter amalonaticus]